MSLFPPCYWCGLQDPSFLYLQRGLYQPPRPKNDILSPSWFFSNIHFSCLS
ncbi:unnamed protein product [Spirodela intermedia]|uniref:Uncharacterized protein n=2 Tax=Spirodela intermedia TaxID=51605 RepID=A0A7I8LLN4_SPIIN|nr:unnamed protein product [Spirodela intermedia]CAA6673757.1 unnamed protein product [Spirodela intermedia]CAA7410993.1 unnamed protein product [Spirodela intermedia]